MSKHEKRKAGDLLRTLGDFGLGMFGAAATGVATFSHARQREKASKDPEDLVSNAAEAVKAMFREASQVAGQAQDELRLGEKSAADRPAPSAAKHDAAPAKDDSPAPDYIPSEFTNLKHVGDG